MNRASLGRALRVVGSIAIAVVVLAYPLLVYTGMTRLGARPLGLIVFFVACASAALRVAGRGNSNLAYVLVVPCIAVGCALATMLTDDPRAIYALPVAINGTLGVYFAHSLRGIPMIERFARLSVAELGPAQLAHCRQATIAWVVFFIVNASIALVLAVEAPLAIWALYTGVVGYVLMGLLGASEFLIRRYRFREFGDAWYDRLLARALPIRGSGR